MTDATETLDTLIAEIEGDIRFAHSSEQADYARRMLKALTDLRTERDGLAAIIEKAKSAAASYSYRGLAFMLLNMDDGILATAPTTALADRDARILEEAADEWERDGVMSLWDGYADNFLRARAASRRAEAHEGDSTSRDSGSAS